MRQIFEPGGARERHHPGDSRIGSRMPVMGTHLSKDCSESRCNFAVRADAYHRHPEAGLVANAVAEIAQEERRRSAGRKATRHVADTHPSHLGDRCDRSGEVNSESTEHVTAESGGQFAHVGWRVGALGARQSNPSMVSILPDPTPACPGLGNAAMGDASSEGRS